MNIRPLTVVLLNLYIYDRISCDQQDENFIRPTYCRGSVPTESYVTASSRSVIKCSALCSEECRCLSVSYFPANRTCKLSHDILAPDCSNSLDVPGSLYYQKKGAEQACRNGGALSGDDCNCIDGYIGRCCERIMTDCSDGYRNGYSGKPRGLYKVFPPGAPFPFTVHCRMAWGGRTYVLQHYDPKKLFNLTWSDYVGGVDFAYSNDWIGLQKLNWLTNARYLKLIIELTENEDKFHLLVYDNFHVGDASTEFRLLGASLKYSSIEVNLIDCLAPLVGSAFSTIDRDNDGNDGRNCSHDYRGGWWFNSQCAQCNPTGDIHPSPGGPRTWANNEIYWDNLSWSPEAISMWLE